MSGYNKTQQITEVTLSQVRHGLIRSADLISRNEAGMDPQAQLVRLLFPFPPIQPRHPSSHILLSRNVQLEQLAQPGDASGIIHAVATLFSSTRPALTPLYSSQKAKIASTAGESYAYYRGSDRPGITKPDGT